jgi:hypothetical protein
VNPPNASPRTTAALPRLHAHLDRLYGPAVAEAWTPRLAERLADAERRLDARRRRRTSA